MIAGRSYFDFAVEQPALYEIIYVPTEVLGAQSVDASVADEACAIGQFWSDRVREMMDAGYLRKGNPHEISLTLWGHAHGLMSIYHRGLLPVTAPGDFRDLMTNSFLRIMAGLGTEEFEVLAERIRSDRNLTTLTA